MPQATAQPEFCGGWDLTWDQAVGCCSPDGLGSLSVDEQEGFIERACEFLWRRTGRRFGSCQATITLTPDRCGTHRGPCRCAGSGDRLPVPLVPVQAIDHLVVGTAQLLEGVHFEVLNRSTLRRIDGRNWPRWERITLTVTYGIVPPPELIVAAGVLAVNLAKSESGVACEFPPRTKTVHAESMSIEMHDPLSHAEEGLSGIPRVDSVILALWPHRGRPAPGGVDPMCVGPEWDEVTPSPGVT